jgi:hypothetical protein
MQKVLVEAAFFVIDPGMDTGELRKGWTLLLALCALTPLGATAEPVCGVAVEIAAPIDGPLHQPQRVEGYRPVLEICRRKGEADRLATRRMRVDDENLLLSVDPQSLETRIENAACWTCSATTDEQQGQTRFIQSIDAAATKPGKKLGPEATWLDNAGLTSGRGPGAFMTGDLCPSRKPLERAFLMSLEQTGQSTPVALSISGLWIRQHPQDFAWLRREKAEGRLAITFVNHSFNHRYQPGLSDSANFLLMPGTDPEHEILDVERLLIANGETPSVFFRFPGLISDPGWMETLREKHLIPLGADAWLALSMKKPAPGAIVLVHPNGNEPLGLNDFKRFQDRKEMPQPFRPLTEAP